MARMPQEELEMEKKDAIRLVSILVTASMNYVTAKHSDGGKVKAAIKEAAAAKTLLEQLTGEEITEDEVEKALGW
jgi:benzoyl-CoA reductase/2-hydroxyglutaryl-CoA dehydratase subunit BcrC/BadD/HgdB